MAAVAPLADFGTVAPDFRLRGTDGHIYSLADVKGERGTVVVFMCNHCPYVKAILDRLIRDARELAAHGVSVVGINPNDPVAYPEDSFERMVELAPRLGFPYLWDETQDVARAYGAVCTPDFFGYDRELKLRYRGQLDASRKLTAPEGARRELFEAMCQIAATGEGPREQMPSIGCSIKWRGDAS